MMGDLQALLEKLSWIVLGAAAGVFEPNSADAVSLFQDDAYVSGLASTNHGEVASVDCLGMEVSGLFEPGVDFVTSINAQIAIFRDAGDEAKRAIRLLQGLRTELSLPEVSDYVRALEEIVSNTPEESNVQEAGRFSLWLRAARAQLANQASSFDTWLGIAELVDPTGAPHPVPSRFIQWEEPVNEPVVEDAQSEARVRQTLAAFLRDDAYPGSLQS